MKTAIAIAALLVASIAAPGAYAQDSAPLKASVSYAFVVGRRKEQGEKPPASRDRG